jgi:hypothetical protein
MLVASDAGTADHKGRTQRRHCTTGTARQPHANFSFCCGAALNRVPPQRSCAYLAAA